jgi:hypothetical protein
MYILLVAVEKCLLAQAKMLAIISKKLAVLSKCVARHSNDYLLLRSNGVKIGDRKCDITPSNVERP